MGVFKFVSYWETAAGRLMPPYVALALVSIQRALGDSFLLLTPENTPEYIGTDYLNKTWGFTKLGFDFAPNVAAIVAKADFIRMAYVYQHGGVWLDADTLVFSDPTPYIFGTGPTAKLHWYSEAFFGSRPGNALLEQAVVSALNSESHDWGNPGNIRGLIAHEPNLVLPISNYWLDPGYRPMYNFTTCEVMRSTEVTIEEFFTNSDMKLLQLYNTYFSRTATLQQSVSEFLQSNTLLAKLYLHLEPNKDYWLSEANTLIARCQFPG